MEKKHVLVIGGGIIGTLVARELSKYNCKITVFEKARDIGWGITKANSGIIHAGYADSPDSLRAKYCAAGNRKYSVLSQELDFDFKRVGSIVAAFNEEETKSVESLLEQGKVNGVPGLRILSREEVLKLEPLLNPSVKIALYAESAGIVAPWEVAIAAFENARSNGAEFHFLTGVIRFTRKGGKVEVETEKGSFLFDFVVNASGLYADEVASASNIRTSELFPRKGEYILLDESEIVGRIVFPAPSKMGKGILVLPTVHDTTLLGPTAEDLPPSFKDNTETTRTGIEQVIAGARKLVPSVDLSRTIRTFAGLRPENAIHDFEITFGDFYVNLSATRSPGLTSAPKIAEEVSLHIKEVMHLSLKRDFYPLRKRIPSLRGESKEKQKKLIEMDSSYGRVVCRCNRVTEAEVVEAIRRGATTVDGIKFRTLAQFGRCQGSFCLMNIMRILSRELGIPMNEIDKNNPGSCVLDGDVK